MGMGGGSSSSGTQTSGLSSLFSSLGQASASGSGADTPVAPDGQFNDDPMSSPAVAGLGRPYDPALVKARLAVAASPSVYDYSTPDGQAQAAQEAAQIAKLKQLLQSSGGGGIFGGGTPGQGGLTA